MTTFTLTDLVDQAEQLTAQIAVLQQQRDALRITAELLSRDALDTAFPTNDIPEPPPRDDPPHNSLPIDNMENLDVDFTGTRNMLERLQRLGRAAEGHYLSLGLMAHYLDRHKKRRGSLRSLRTHIRTCIAKHREHFQRVGPGIYCYYDTPRPRSVWEKDGYDLAADLEH